MRQGIVGLAAVIAFSAAAGSAMGGYIRFGTDPASTSGRYNGTDGSGGAFVITNKGVGYNGLYGDNRTVGDLTTDNSAAANPNLRLVDSGVEQSFLSFCIERNEYISNGAYYWTEISTTARFGGTGGGTGGEDQLSGRTALLYNHFRNIGTDGVVPGTLFGGAIADGTWDAGDSSALQLAIWASEDEAQISSLAGLSLALYNWANLNNDGGLHGVRVLRLWTNENLSGPSQDQLTLIQLPPAAWAGLSTLAGVGFVGYIRRRKNTAQ